MTSLPVPVLLAWSGGKDICMSLQALQQSGAYCVKALLTTMTNDRIGVHGVRRALLVAQAEALGCEVEEVAIPPFPSNDVYEAAMTAALVRHSASGIDTVAFGDLFLEDIRAYREALMARIGMRPIFPVWGHDTRSFFEAFLAAGFRAIIVCVDLAVLDVSFAGRILDAACIRDLPPGVDPCGENGEFHTFVFDGPNFAKPVDVVIGARSVQGGYGYCDLTL